MQIHYMHRIMPALLFALVVSSVFDASVHAQETTRTTISGHVFVRDTSIPAFGEAWRDETGMIWGDLVTEESGQMREMSHYNATEYCTSIGAQLPALEDLRRLRNYFGAPTQYVPQVLPHLQRRNNLGRPISYYYWSSTVYPRDSRYAHVFLGFSGAFHTYARLSDWSMHGNAVRCVVRH